MKEIQITCNPFSGEIMVEDPPGSKKYLGYFRKPEELSDFFNKTHEGKYLLERKKLHVLVDLGGLKSYEIRSGLERVIDTLKWNRARIDYKYDKNVYTL